MKTALPPFFLNLAATSESAICPMCNRDRSHRRFHAWFRPGRRRATHTPRLQRILPPDRTSSARCASECPRHTGHRVEAHPAVAPGESFWHPVRPLPPCRADRSLHPASSARNNGPSLRHWSTPPEVSVPCSAPVVPRGIVRSVPGKLHELPC